MRTNGGGLHLQQGDVLRDDAGETRWEVFQHLAAGRSFDLWLVDDRHLEGVRAVAKTIRHAPGADEAAVAARRALFDDERDLYVLPQTMLPEPLDWLVLAGEPVLVYEHQSGETLESLIATRFANGLGEARALRLVRELAHVVAEVHAEGFVLRDLSPPHIVLGLDDTLQLIGLGNAARTGAARPNDVYKISRSDPFSAPETSAAGASAHPSADVHSLGVLLAYLSGGSATARLSGPLADVAARCTAPATRRPTAQAVYEELKRTTLPRTTVAVVAPPRPAAQSARPIGTREPEPAHSRASQASAPARVAPQRAPEPIARAPEEKKEKAPPPEKKPEKAPEEAPAKKRRLGAAFWIVLAVLALGGAAAAIYFLKIRGGL